MLLVLKSVLVKNKGMKLRAVSGQQVNYKDGTKKDISSTIDIVNPYAKILAENPVGTNYVVLIKDQYEGDTDDFNYAVMGTLHVILKNKEQYFSPSPTTGLAPTYPGDSIFFEAQKILKHAESIKDDATVQTETPRGSYLYRMTRNKEILPPTIEDDGFYVDKDIWYLFIRNIQNSINTMLIGPTGSGKTELVLLASKKLKKESHIYDMGSMMDPIASLLGVHRIGKGGVSVFDYAKFTQDIQKEGIILLDELSRAPINTNNILFPCLDSRRFLPVEIAGGEDARQIKCNSSCAFVATANVGIEYTGTNSMDKALVNRFFPIELDYMSKEQESNVLKTRCGISSASSDIICHVAKQIRDLYKKQELSDSVSIRETLMIGKLAADGWTVAQALNFVLMPIFEGTDSEGERSKVKQIIMTM